MENSKVNLNKWEEVLSHTGEKLSGEKSFCYMGKWVLGMDYKSKITQLCGEIKYHAVGREHPELVRILDSPQPCKYLGIEFRTDSSWQEEWDKRFLQVRNLQQMLVKSSLTSHEEILSYSAIWIPQIIYAIKVVTFSEIECRRIEDLLHKLHIKWHFPRAILFGAEKYGGIQFDELFNLQGKIQL